MLNWRLVSNSYATSSHRPDLQTAVRAACGKRGLPRCTGSLKSRRFSRVTAAASKSFYDVLGVDKSSDLKSIKSAYKKKALKLHPDVNKEPDAKELFMEAKTAYQTLADAEQRRKYDRTLDGSNGGFDWGSFGGAFRGTAQGSPQQPRRPRREEEEFYGFDAFFKDLDKDFEASQAEQTGQPKSLWQEVRDIGEEFVEFLEHEVASIDRRSRKNRDTADHAARSAEEDAKAATAAARTSAEEQARRAKEAAETAKRKADQEIDDMLSDFKRNLNTK